MLSNYAGYRQSASQPYSDDFYLTLIDHTLIATQGTRKTLVRREVLESYSEHRDSCCGSQPEPGNCLPRAWLRAGNALKGVDLSLVCALALCHSACGQQLQAATHWEWSFQGGEEQPNTPLNVFQYLLPHCSTPPADSGAALTWRSVMPLIKTD